MVTVQNISGVEGYELEIVHGEQQWIGISVDPAANRHIQPGIKTTHPLTGNSRFALFQIVRILFVSIKLKFRFMQSVKSEPRFNRSILTSVRCFLHNSWSAMWQ